MLIDRVKELTTDWKDIIIEWINKNQELWNRMENYTSKRLRCCLFCCGVRQLSKINYGTIQ